MVKIKLSNFKPKFFKKGEEKKPKEFKENIYLKSKIEDLAGFLGEKLKRGQYSDFIQLYLQIEKFIKEHGEEAKKVVEEVLKDQIKEWRSDKEIISKFEEYKEEYLKHLNELDGLKKRENLWKGALGVDMALFAQVFGLGVYNLDKIAYLGPGTSTFLLMSLILGAPFAMASGMVHAELVPGKIEKEITKQDLEALLTGKVPEDADNTTKKKASYAKKVFGLIEKMRKKDNKK